MSAEILASSKTKGGSFEVYLLPYCPSYSFFAVDPDDYSDIEDTDGYISIELQGYHFMPANTPNFTLFKINPNHSKFYKYYRDIWKEMMKDAKKFEG